MNDNARRDDPPQPPAREEGAPDGDAVKEVVEKVPDQDIEHDGRNEPSGLGQVLSLDLCMRLRGRLLILDRCVGYGAMVRRLGVRNGADRHAESTVHVHDRADVVCRRW